MKIYNSLTKQIEDFTPIHEGAVSLYSCGPTVYNNLHIGNLSAFIYADLLRRTLSLDGYDVKHVMNITDVDDKTIRDSKKAYPEIEPKEALKLLTDKYSNVFMHDLKKTGNDLSSIEFVSAVASIPEMITLTQKLLDNNIAYVADDGVYFSVSAYVAQGNTYGRLQQVDIEHSKARVANDEYDKDSASDFALWKKEESGEPSWDATFESNDKSYSIPGRPGWHIECSAMSEKLLGVPLDIHTGGIDLKFPHHENEIAQSCGAGHDEFSHYFVHNNHMLVDGRKMSKSLGNFYTLRDIEDRGFDPQAFRLAVLEGHYQSESNFSWEILEAASNRLHKWQAAADLSWQREAAPASQETLENIKAALFDNLNTPKALANLDGYFDEISSKDLAPGDDVVAFLNKALGLNICGEDITDEQKNILKKREKARADKDWGTSDTLRDELARYNLHVRDSSTGQLWERIR